MKIHNKKFLGIVFLLFFSLLILPTSILSIQGYATRNPSVYEMSFIHAEYMDADLDGSEDDTRFSVDVYFNPEYFTGSLIKLECLFEIILPSEASFTFKGYIRLDSVSCVIQFDAYNTVTEPGWYTINFSSFVRLQNMRYTCYCSIVFDPPTGTGEGGGVPTIGLNIG